MPVTPYEDGDAQDPRVCPTTPPYRRNDTLGGYFKMVGESFKDFAPEDGCCPAVSFKYVNVKSYTGQPKDVCTCIRDDMRVAD